MCGQHCEPSEGNLKRKVLGYEDSTVCLETVLAQSYTVLDDGVIDHMFLHAPEVIRTVIADGCVTDSLLEFLEIVKLPEDLHIDSDNLVTWRQHAHVLSHTDSKAKFVNYLQMRTERDDPVLQLQRKQQEQAAKVVLRATKLKEKEDNAVREKALKAAEKAAEKDRRLALTQEERKIEDTERKSAAARSKILKAAASAEQLRNAVAVLENQGQEV